MSLTGKAGRIKYYLFKILKKTIRKRVEITDKHKKQLFSNPLLGEERFKFNDCLVRERLLVKILNECFNLDVDTTLIAMEVKKEKEELKK